MINFYHHYLANVNECGLFRLVSVDSGCGIRTHVLTNCITSFAYQQSQGDQIRRFVCILATFGINGAFCLWESGIIFGVIGSLRLVNNGQLNKVAWVTQKANIFGKFWAIFAWRLVDFSPKHLVTVTEVQSINMFSGFLGHLRTIGRLSARNIWSHWRWLYLDSEETTWANLKTVGINFTALRLFHYSIHVLHVNKTETIIGGTSWLSVSILLHLTFIVDQEAIPLY